MKRLVRGVTLGTMLAVVGLSTGLAADTPNPLLGTWQLNVEKSTFVPGPPPKGQLRIYSREGEAERLTAKGVNANGEPVLVQYTARYDGKDYAMTGSSNGDTISLKRIDQYTTQSTQKKAGVVAITSRRIVSKDGKTFTATNVGTDAKGRKVDSVLVFERR